MITTYSAIAALVGYLIASIMLLRKNQDFATQPLRMSTFSVGVLAILLHLGSFCGQLSEYGLDLGLFNLLSLIGWLISSILLFSALKKPLRSLLLVVWPVSAVLILMSLVLPSEEVSTLSPPILTHVIFSLLAYALLSLAALQAIIVAFQDYQLRHRHASGFIMQLPPLMVMESLLFEFVWVGFILLSASIISGFIFLEDMFAQHLAHKTVFSLMAWIIFSLLLFGRHRLGWRGAKAIYWTLSGYWLLMLGFIGSKLVLEFILTP